MMPALFVPQILAMQSQAVQTYVPVYRTVKRRRRCSRGRVGRSDKYSIDRVRCLVLSVSAHGLCQLTQLHAQVSSACTRDTASSSPMIRSNLQ
jgi:hypothetical protein